MRAIFRSPYWRVKHCIIKTMTRWSNTVKIKHVINTIHIKSCATRALNTGCISCMHIVVIHILKTRPWYRFHVWTWTSRKRNCTWYVNNTNIFLLAFNSLAKIQHSTGIQFVFNRTKKRRHLSMESFIIRWCWWCLYLTNIQCSWKMNESVNFRSNKIRWFRIHFLHY